MERGGFVRWKGITVHETIDRDDSTDDETKVDNDVSVPNFGIRLRKLTVNRERLINKSKVRVIFTFDESLSPSFRTFLRTRTEC